MRKIITFIAALTIATGISAGTDIRPATAMFFNCNNARAMLVQAHSMMPGRTASTGDVDKDFARAEFAISRAQAAMARVETRCGKTAAAKESAALLLRESEDRMRLFRNEATSL